jgi:putative oxidoreductase
VARQGVGYCRCEGGTPMNLSAYAPRALAVLRIVAALLFLEHGTSKLFDFPVPFPMPGALPPMLIVAGAIELIGGALIAAGLFTRAAAFIASGEMAVAYFIGHAPKGFWPVGNMGDAAILYCFIFLYLVFAGPGSWALDNVRGRSNRTTP